jgi:hypothetical protein
LLLSKVILIFIGGVLLDWLGTRYTRSIAAGQRGPAALLSGMITLTNLALWSTILRHAESTGIYGAVAMAGGASVGTLLGFRHKLV